MQPIYFASRGRTLFGWLHGAGGAASTGVVICAPFGFEAMCVHRSLRAFAETLASGGVPALRFDYAGTGDSVDLDGHGDQLEVWRDNIVSACDELRARAGVTHICLLGVRLGALLAHTAAAGAGAERLIAIAPVLNGTRYLRELELALWQNHAANATAEAARAQELPGSTRAAPPAGTEGPLARVHGGLDLGGFVLNEATIDALRRADLTAAPAPRAVLVIDRADLPGAQRWSRMLGDAGVACDYLCSGEYASMMRSPQFAAVPRAMIDRCVTWVTAHAPQVVTENPVSAPYTLACDSPLNANVDGVCERPVFFGADVRLFGIATEPPRHEARQRGVILLNSASDSHIGPRRLHVGLARQWARHGYTVLRMDLAGLGDSATRAGCTPNVPFPPEAIADIATAADWLREHYALHELTLAGLCSGAYHALRAAVAGVRVNRLLMVNPFSYRPHRHVTIDEIQLGDVVRAPDIYGARARSKASWMRLLTGRADLRRIARVYGRLALLMLGSGLREAARCVHLPLPGDLGRELVRLTERGTRLVFVFASGEAGQALLKLEAGSTLRRLGTHCQMHVIEGADHDCARAAPRAILEQVLSAELYALTDAAAVVGRAERAVSTSTAAA